MYNIQPRLTEIINRPSYDDFIFDFLLAYEIPKSNIDRIRKGDLNTLETLGEFILRKKVHFKISDRDLYSTIEKIKTDVKMSKSKPRFIIVTNFNKLLAFDTKIGDSLDIEFLKLDKNYDFFLPLIGIEKQQYQNENIADVKAANNLAKLFDEIVKDNDHTTASQRHALNIFLSRLLFCFFAEDTGIFTSTQFTNSLSSHTKADGSDTHIYLGKLFEIFNIQRRDDSFMEYLKSFPYVNGKLFEDTYDVPKFTTKSRKLLIELGQLDWSGINPDIFGSMMQGVMDIEERANLGSHYTSVPNIMKVIQPLFLDDLYEAFEECNGNKSKLQALLTRISKIKFFDPACGSGNFLIIAYKEIRRLEIQILKEIGIENILIGSSHISLSQFYGIEINDFAHETAKLSLYLAEHQMNLEFTKEIGSIIKSLPLRLGGNIVCGNATRIDWEEVCPKNEGDEIYIIGNPPYQGARKQSKSQKADLDFVFSDFKKYRDLDYISIRFYKGSKYINGHNIKLSFVSTNSICQGEQVSMLWPSIFHLNIEINFAYQSFKWKNNAKGNAGVSVVIIGLCNIQNNKKFLYIGNKRKEVSHINAYLISGNKIIIRRLNKSISGLPNMPKGNMPYDGGFLSINKQEKDDLIFNFPHATKFIKKLVGAQELIDGIEKWCIWIPDNMLEEALAIAPIKSRIESVKTMRLSSTDKGAHKLAKKAHQFRETNVTSTNSIIIPLTTSERREYIPLGILSKDYIITNAASVIYDAELWIFGIISSKIHLLWVKAVGGSLETRIRYSSVLCYNTFPFPSITKKQKDEIEEYVYAVLDERERHSQKTLAQLYDPDKMPEGLRQAHHELDLAIERCYRPKPFESDEERLEYLFKMYERMMAKEKDDNK